MTVTITPTTSLTTTPPSISLAITTTTETSTTILRNNPDGTQTAVRTSDGNPLPVSGGTATLVDYEPWYGYAVSYTSLESPSSVSTAVTLDPGVTWLIHPGVPALSQAVQFRPGTLQQEVHALRRGVFYPMGRTNPVVVTDGARKSGSSSVTLFTTTLTDYGNLMALLSTGSPLLLNVPASLNTGFNPSYIAIGDVQVNRWTDTVIDAYRDIVCPFDVVDAPVGGSQATRSYTDLFAFSSYAQMDANYPSYTALLAGP